MALADVNQDDFEQEVLKSDIPVIIDLWAPWCGPCKALTPNVESVAEDYSGEVKALKLNIDENPAIAARYQIMSIPTLLFFKDGEVVNQIVGLVDKTKIESRLKPLL